MKKLFTWVALTLMMALQVFPAQAESGFSKQAAAQWIDKETRSTVSPSNIRRIVDAAWTQSKKHGLDPFLILSTMKTESRFKPTASNSYGALGLMQVVPRWHRDKIAGRNIMDIDTNVEVGTQILVDCLNKNNQAMRSALRCYSGGAKNYDVKLRDGHHQMRNADVLYRFENELPMAVQYAKFEQPFQYVSSPVMTGKNSYSTDPIYAFR